jgi:TetR/AcrR family transcriptional regulator, transcriptional repressor for nem operon
MACILENRHSQSRLLTARGAATRSRIVNKAADLIYEHGVDRTSLDAIDRVANHMT